VREESPPHRGPGLHDYGSSTRTIEDLEMDLLMILGTLAFFVVAIAYTAACDKLK
jgi:hypothetical protein